MNKRIALILLIAPLTFIVLTKIIPCLTWRSDIKREFVVRDAEGKAIEEARVYLLIRQGGERVWPVTLALPWYVDKRYNDMDEALSHPVKVQEGGKFTIDVKLYYPS